MTQGIRLASEDLEIEVWPLGARLNGVWFQGIGTLVDGAASEEEALEAKKYNGAVVGPVANRIAGAQATIEGRECRFEANENEVTTLHAGAAGVHARTWQIETQDEQSLKLSLDLADGDGGFPGTRHLSVTYLVSASTLQVQFEATTDAPTWINLALHPYWSLGAARKSLLLQVAADRYTPVNELKIPTGDIDAVDGTIFDFRTLGAPSSDIDHNFVLSGQNPAVVLASPELRLEIETDAPGVQIYSGKDIGIAIEPQHFPDAMHHPHFPSIALYPNETYRQTSTYRFLKP
ncbi:MAG: aldose epimerase family protein [Pseudomonadota bacterium]